MPGSSRKRRERSAPVSARGGCTERGSEVVSSLRRPARPGSPPLAPTDKAPRSSGAHPGELTGQPLFRLSLGLLTLEHFLPAPPSRSREEPRRPGPTSPCRQRPRRPRTRRARVLPEPGCLCAVVRAGCGKPAVLFGSALVGNFTLER